MALSDATASLALLESKPFPWKEATTDEGEAYFYDESSDESVYKLPPEDAAIYYEKKRLLKVIQSAKDFIESASKKLGKTSGDVIVGSSPQVASEAGGLVDAEGSGDKITAKKPNSKLPLHLQKASATLKEESAAKKNSADNGDSDEKESADALVLQKVMASKRQISFEINSSVQVYLLESSAAASAFGRIQSPVPFRYVLFLRWSTDALASHASLLYSQLTIVLQRRHRRGHGLPVSHF